MEQQEISLNNFIHTNVNEILDNLKDALEKVVKLECQKLGKTSVCSDEHDNSIQKIKTASNARSFVALARTHVGNSSSDTLKGSYWIKELISKIPEEYRIPDLVVDENILITLKNAALKFIDEGFEHILKACVEANLFNEINEILKKMFVIHQVVLEFDVFGSTDNSPPDPSSIQNAIS